MNALTRVDETAISPATLEQVLAKGDLAPLTVAQRLEYYSQVCRSLGLNPLTRPFRFLSFEGTIALYATKDCADQLRASHSISLAITSQRREDNVYVVAVRATAKDGRTDEDIGAVVLTGQGLSIANATMKAITKAKRRVTLSICGLGFLDESELDTLPGAKTFDVDAEPPPAGAPKAEVYATGGADLRSQINREVPLTPKRTVRLWLDDLRLRVAQCTTQGELDQLAASDEVRKASSLFKGGALDELNAMMADAIERLNLAEPEKAEEEDVFPGDLPS